MLNNPWHAQALMIMNGRTENVRNERNEDVAGKEENE
jgi:hypothetical protein